MVEFDVRDESTFKLSGDKTYYIERIEPNRFRFHTDSNLDPDELESIKKDF